MPAISGGSDFKPAKCPNCGRSPDVKSPCSATGKTCSACQSIGHFRSMCRKNTTTQKSRSHIPSTSSKSLGLVKLQGATTSDSPCTVPVITQLATESVGISLDWLPDTGSDVDPIGPQHLEELGQFPDNLAIDLDNVCAAVGQCQESIGKISANLSEGSTIHHATIHVYDGLSDALLSRQSLQVLGYLQPNWPQIAACTVQTKPEPFPTKPVPSVNSNAVQMASKLGAEPSASQIAAIRAQLLEEVADVFNSDVLRPMTGDPMDIQLRSDAIPFCVNTARTLPYTYPDKVKATCMVRKGIIQPVNEPTDWGCPMVVVSKKGTDEVHLTGDLSKLNKQVARPVHPACTWLLTSTKPNSSLNWTLVMATGKYRCPTRLVY